MSTQQEIKRQLLQGKVLTSCEAARKFQTADLRKYICNLKEEGLNVCDEWVTSSNNKRYKRYWYGGEKQSEA